MAAVLRLLIAVVLNAAICEVDMAAICTLVSDEISEVVKAISAVARALMPVTDRLEIPEIAVAIEILQDPGHTRSWSNIGKKR